MQILHGINIVFTQRDEETMKKRSTSAYAKKIKTLRLSDENNGNTYSGRIDLNSKRKKTSQTPNFELEI